MSSSSKSNHAVQQYLSRYAESEISHLEPLIQWFERQGALPFAHALTLPLCSEDINALLATFPLTAQASAVVILVVNEPPAALPAVQSANHRLIALLHSLAGDNLYQRQNLCAMRINNTPVILVNRTGAMAIPSDEGVGLARKIGMDISLALWAQGHVANHWLKTTDADATLPTNYFDAPTPRSASALLCRYEYLFSDDDLSRATALYDLRTREYQEGLQEAGSAYAYNPVGSLMWVQAADYAAVRGVPKKSGGEDFYLLNKLQKIGGVVQLQQSVIELQCRTSDRVPFGTGPAVSRLLTTPDIYQIPLMYHPQLFSLLKTTLEYLRITEPQKWLTGDLADICRSALISLKPQAAQRHLTKHWSNPQRYQQHLNDWFDAFRTLKFLHYLRSESYPDLSYRDWVGLSGRDPLQLMLPGGHGQNRPEADSFLASHPVANL